MFYLICLICPNWYQPVSKIHELIVGFVLKKEKAACQTAVYLIFSIIKRNRRLRSSAITSSLDPPLASEMFPSAQSVTEMSKNSCKSENCKQKKELPVTAVTCDRSVKCERVWISSVPERPEVPVQTDSPGAPCGEEEGSVVELNHSCQSGKWIVTCLERGSDERGHTVTCRLSVTDTHTAYRIPGLVWTALVRSAIHGPAATRHPVCHWANISLPTETKEHLRCWQRFLKALRNGHKTGPKIKRADHQNERVDRAMKQKRRRFPKRQINNHIVCCLLSCGITDSWHQEENSPRSRLKKKDARGNSKED